MGELAPLLEGLTGAEVTLTGGGVLLLFIAALFLPDRFRPFYMRPYVGRLKAEIETLRQERDYYRAKSS